MSLRLAIIIGSTRQGRFGPTVARWFAAQVKRHADLELDLIDLAETGLPDALDEETIPPQVTALGTRLAAADAFVIVTPEYNQSFPAPLKTAIDWFTTEWQTKPVAFVSYGRESGGLNAVAQLRQIFTELDAVTVRTTISLPCYWEKFAADGSWPKPSSNLTVKPLLDQLTWWALALHQARTNLKEFPS